MFGEECRFSHVTRDGELVQEPKAKKAKKSKKKNKKKKKSKKSEKQVVRKTKEECIAEREIDEEEQIYTGTVKFYKKGYGFIKIEEEITFKYVTAEDIMCESEEIGLNKDDKVMFKIYKDSKGLGAMDVMNEDGSAIVFEREEQKEEEAQ